MKESKLLYVDKFDNDNNRSDFFKDSAIIKLFDKFPNNTDLDEVLAKVTLLNAFYSTQILDMDLLNVSRDIVVLNIDGSIHGENVENDIVNRIAYGGKFYQRKLYSFASKYCSFHNPAKFPIVDSYSKGMLYYINNCEDSRFHFFTQGFTQNDLNNYHNYCKVYIAFVKHFKLENEFLNTCVNIVLFHFVLYLAIANNCSEKRFRDSKNDEKSCLPIIIIQKQMCHKTDTALT